MHDVKMLYYEIGSHLNRVSLVVAENPNFEVTLQILDAN